MLNIIKTLNDTRKLILMCFLIIKTFDDNKKTYLHERFFVSIQNYTIDYVKIVKKFQVFLG